MWWWWLGCAPEAPGPTDSAAGWGDRCVPADGPRSPRSLDEMWDLIDALPGPTVDVPCVLQALDRPLSIELTVNPVSAQPAASARSPRVFLRAGDLTISVVPEGNGRPLMEFSEYRPALGASVKAELHFPLAVPFDRREPFARVVDHELTDGSLCGLCHWDEVEIEPGVYASTPLRPASATLLDVEDLAAERAACDPAIEPDRCAMLAAIFDFGPVWRGPFPGDWPTIYDNR